MSRAFCAVAADKTITTRLLVSCSDIFSAPCPASAWPISWPITCAISSSLAFSFSMKPV